MANRKSANAPQSIAIKRNDRFLLSDLDQPDILCSERESFVTLLFRGYANEYSVLMPIKAARKMALSILEKSETEETNV